MAWPSSLIYYKTINEYLKKRTSSNGLHTPNPIIIQTDFALIEKAQKDGNWDEVVRLLTGKQRISRRLNTRHPMLHIVDAAAQKVVDRGCKTVSLLGSRYTMTGTYFVGHLQDKYRLRILVTKGEHENNVHNALYEELTKNIFVPETMLKFN